MGGRARLPEQLTPEAQRREGEVVRRLLRGGSGFEAINLDGRSYSMSFARVGIAGWSVAVLYPEDELFGEVRSLRIVQASLVGTGLAALCGVIVLLSRRLTRPLTALSASAGQMATGDLDVQLPPVASQDEMGKLTESFHHMRDSLKTHIQDLKETTAAKERLESELKVARRIQMDMLPRKAAGGETFELTATLVPARAVGGDLYDHFMQDDTHVSFMVGDVSGKGVPAALFMARTKTVLETDRRARAESGGGASRFEPLTRRRKRVRHVRHGRSVFIEHEHGRADVRLRWPRAAGESSMPRTVDTPRSRRRAAPRAARRLGLSPQPRHAPAGGSRRPVHGWRGRGSERRRRFLRARTAPRSH
jgi:HAMP domain-containing protein